MLIEALIAGGFANLVFSTTRSLKIDKQAQKKYTEVYEKQVAAQELIQEAIQKTDKAMVKLANRKKAILTTSMCNFLNLYEEIIKINFVHGDGILELNQSLMLPTQAQSISIMSVEAIKPMSDKELVTTLLVESVKGVILGGVIFAPFLAIGGAMVKDSERNLSVAKSEARASNVVYSQAETAAVVFQSITQRAEQISTLLAKMNLLFSKSLQASTTLIQKNGDERSNYSSDERGILMSCINFADAIKKIVDTPLLNKEGKIAEQSVKALEMGNEYLERIKDI